MEIASFVQASEELRAVLGEEASYKLINASGQSDAKQHQEQLKACFRRLMEADSSVVAAQLGSLVARLQTTPVVHRTPLDMLLLQLDEQYPGDVGCFCVYFLNVVQLQPGEAMFLAANEPHAYLAGDCIECMACSDNVVRAGLTPKFKDVPQLCDMLSYSMRAAADQKCVPARKGNVATYRGPVDDFLVDRVHVPGSEVLAAVDGPSIFIVTGGHGTAPQLALDVEAGHVFFLAANNCGWSCCLLFEMENTKGLLFKVNLGRTISWQGIRVREEGVVVGDSGCRVPDGMGKVSGGLVEGATERGKVLCVSPRGSSH